MPAPTPPVSSLSPSTPTHQRSESAQSQNYSFLEIYDAESSSDVASSPDPREDPPMGLYISSPLAHSAQNVSVSSGNSASKHSISSLIGPPIDQAPSPEEPTPSSGWTNPSITAIDKNVINNILGSNVDVYGFKKASTLFGSTSASYNEWFSKYSAHYLVQKKKWNSLMKSNGLAHAITQTPTRFPPKSDKVKKLVRKGIPPEWRGNAWFFYAGGNEKLNKNVGVYDKIITDTRGIRNKETEIIERDLNRTFPDNTHFKVKEESAGSEQETEIITALRRVLVAFAHYQPQIGYCQSLNFIAGLLLLFMSEDRAFWMLVIMTERIIPKVHSATLEGVHTDQGVLMMCIKEYIPKLWAIIGKDYGGAVLTEDKILTRLPPLTLVTSSWFMSVFIGSLPIESVLRIWDILWYEGSKTIFRISLTICRLCLEHPGFEQSKDGKSDADSEGEQIELFQFIQNLPKSFTDPNLLIDLCFKKIGGYGYGFLSQDEINKCREFVTKQRRQLQHKKNGLGAEMSEQERELMKSSGASFDDEIHDVYGFNKSIMSGVAWNRHMSGIMKKKIAKRMKQIEHDEKKDG